MEIHRSLRKVLASFAALALAACAAGGPSSDRPMGAEGKADCPVADRRFFMAADTEQFPAALSGEIDYKASTQLLKPTDVYYEVLVCRGSGKIHELTKYVGGEPFWGFEYEYNDRQMVIGMKLTYANGRPTSYKILQTI